MDLEMFHGLAEATGPFASVTIDVTRKDPSLSEHIDVRWRESARRLTELGAPDGVVASMREAALEPTGHGGDHGRLVVLNHDGVLQKVDLPGRVTDDAMWGPVPSLLPAVRALSGLVPHVVVRLDRVGADIEIWTGHDADRITVEGSHDELHRVSTGGLSQRRYQARVEDSWEHNAAAVAKELDRVVRRHRPAIVLLMGDEHAMSFLEEHASPALHDQLFRLRTGGRADGTSEGAERAAIESVLAALRARREAEVVARFEEQTGRSEAAAEGLEPVIDVLQRAQVEELLLVNHRVHNQQLWAGTGRLQLGTSRDDAAMTGAEDPVRVPAEAALVWAAVCSRAGVTLLDANQASMSDGVGAVLRWADESTPHARVPTMPGNSGQ